MQDTAMDDLEMDEMFDKHLEEHEAPFDDDQATGRSNAVPAHVPFDASTARAFSLRSWTPRIVTKQTTPRLHANGRSSCGPAMTSDPRRTVKSS